ncbi:integrase catalytic domain-containing protein [Trichonephila clavipes]|nr:integrase catalytic domain-containing protein [Trichonephila clavipes]
MDKTPYIILTNNSIRNYISGAPRWAGFGLDFDNEEYREKALRIELKSKRVLENIKSKQNNNEGSNSGNNSHLADCENPYKAITLRLPEVELYKFGGELKDCGLYNKLSTQLRALSSLGITTDQCGIILYTLVESALPTHILRSFETQRKNNETATLDSIVSFLKSEMQSEEKIKLSRSDIFPYQRECKQLAESQRSLPSANELFINEPNEIRVLCLKNHPVRFSKRAIFIPLEENIAKIKRKGLCRICLAKGHLASRCRSQITCQLCSIRHVKLMCPNIECNKFDSLKQDVNDKNINENIVDSLHSRAKNEVILQTLVVNVHGIKRESKARAIIDTGSQKSYILRSTAEELGFNLQREEEFRHSFFGGTKTRMYKHKCYKIYLSSIDGNYICKLDALDHDIFKKTGPIEVLLGADVAGKLITGRREELKTGLVALETKLGWTLIGKVPRYTDKKDTSMNIVTMLSQEDIPVSSLWDLEMLGIRDTIEQNSREEKEKAVLSHFLETVRQKEDGRYEVHMPWKVDRTFLTDNYELCLKRLESTTRKLEKIGFREKYHEVFRE